MIPVAFTSEESLRFFRSEWKRRVGGVFRPSRKNGENHGFELNTVHQWHAAKEIETLRPGTLIGLPEEVRTVKCPDGRLELRAVKGIS